MEAVVAQPAGLTATGNVISRDGLLLHILIPWTALAATATGSDTASPSATPSPERQQHRPPHTSCMPP